MASTGASDPQIAVVARSGCKYCLKAKDLLGRNSIEYVEVDVTDNVGLLTVIRETTGYRTVPQIFVNGAFIGGFDTLEEQFTNGALASALAAAGAKPALPEELEQKIKKFRAEQARSKSEEQDTGAKDDVPTKLRELAERLQAVPQELKYTKSFSYTRAFSGQQLMLWLQSVNGGDKVAANEAGQQLLQYGLIYPLKQEQQHGFMFFKKSESGPPQDEAVQVSGERWYAMKGTKVEPREKGAALNTHLTYTGGARPAVQLSSHLRTLISSLYDQFLSPDGKGVSYTAMARSPLFDQYVDATAELQRVDLTNLSREQLMSFFINLYNAVIIHATVVFGAPDNTLARIAFFTKLAVYNVGGADYTADDMEHGVLRGNKPAPSSVGSLLGIRALMAPIFKGGDPRARKVVTPLDPRIHFALVCGAKSCPPIRVYEPETLEEGLQGAAEAFCSSEVKVDKTTNTVTSSMILKWYGGDFGGTQLERLEKLLPYLLGQTKEDLMALIAEAKAGRADIKWEFTPYDWSINSSDGTTA